MFKKILIANRGEIALRICRTAKKMGILTVAIYSTADKNSLHVTAADEAYWVGESPSKESYLNIEAIINIAQKSGAEAIHPGYGFLSENTDFAMACVDANLCFIGPSIQAMEAMASKQLAKLHLEKTKVPLIPGYHGLEQEDAFLFEKANDIGFPVLLKAANGGGGKGMRPVYKAKDFQQALLGARREAKAYFADDTLIIEKLLEKPRHVEVQIFADHFSQVVHLFERDCSIQRRHQKVIEEAPAPDLSNALLEKLRQAAIEVALSIDYLGAGTVEFLVDQSGAFYFMEMNTRLQVEHPVTEMITGIDLVEWQIKIAAKNPLPLKQKEIKASGHAIECRIYAEDPVQDFIPSIGEIHFLKEPQGDGIRIDSGVAIHSCISQFYDPMIAKLIAYGQNRDEALLRLEEALKQYAIGGVKTNIPFLQAILKTAGFKKPNLSTHFLAEEPLKIAEPSSKQGLAFALAFDYLTLFQAEQDPLFKANLGWQLHLDAQWVWQYQIFDEVKIIRIKPIDTKSFYYSLEEEEPQFCAVQKTEYHAEFVIDNGEQELKAFVQSYEHSLYVYLPEGLLVFKRSSLQDIEQESNHQGQLTAPMPSTVVAILKKPGEIVKKGELLMVLEAMKMEHAIYAPNHSIIKELCYTVGAQVQEGALLVRLEDSLDGEG